MEKKCFDALVSEQNRFFRPWRGSWLFMHKYYQWVVKLSLVGHETIISCWFYKVYDYFHIILLLKYHICYTDSSLNFTSIFISDLQGLQIKSISLMWVAAQKGWKSVRIALETDECIDSRTGWKTDRQTDGGCQYDFDKIGVQTTTSYARSDFPNNIYRIYHFRPRSALNIHKHCTLPKQHVYGFIYSNTRRIQYFPNSM
jgi:hypothetical protein